MSILKSYQIASLLISLSFKINSTLLSSKKKLTKSRPIYKSKDFEVKK